ncbi:MAG: asparagine synthase (glutamine-hydrolyzing) [Candidatus Nanopelagicales bacterium]
MCGIAGVVGARSGDRTLIEGITRTMTHRGPDNEGYWMSEKASLGMRRLSIVDVQHGHQPYLNETGSVAVVFNGEIYNHQELRGRLEDSGHQLSSHADGEVIAHLYEEDPQSFMHQLDGMFAIAIVDRTRDRITLIRDRWGKKPLLYTSSNGTLAFASEMRALLGSGLASDQADEIAIDAYLRLGYVPAPQTAVQGVLQVPPGHMLTGDLAGNVLDLECWWAPIAQPDESIDLASAVERTGALLLEAVRKRLISERPIGIFLSGGVDSSLVAAAAVRVSSGPVHTFSIGFGNPDYDETRYAEQVARVLGTVHTTFHADDLLDGIVGDLTEVLDQPFADSSIMPTLLLVRMARERVVVALGGDGGDELFGGYVRYRAAPALQRMQRMPGAFTIGRNANALLERVLGTRRATRLNKAMTEFPSLEQRYSAIIAMNPDHHSSAATAALHAAWLAQPELPAALRPRASDLRMYLPSDILFKADIATMASGLELRSPLLDRDVSAFALTLPRHLLLSGGGKPVLKALAKSWIEHFDASRPKMGFGIPIEYLHSPGTAEGVYLPEAGAWTDARLHAWSSRWLPAVPQSGEQAPDTGNHDIQQLHAVEVLHGLGLGGTEQALVRRLRHQPAGVRTTIINTEPLLDHFTEQIHAISDRIAIIAPMSHSRKALVALINSLQPDVVITHTPRNTLKILTSDLASTLPVVVIAHSTSSSNLAWMHPPISLALSMVNHRARLHIAVSSQAARGGQCRDARRVVVAQEGAELEEASLPAIGWPTDARIRLLTLSRLIPLKNLPELVEAVADEAALMRHEHACLAIAGEGPDATNIAHMIERRQVSDIVHLIGAISPPTSLLEQADALVVSSTAEGGPITIFEALLAGTRVVSTPVGVAQDVLVDDPGLIVTRDSSQASLRDGLRQILTRGPLSTEERLHRAQTAQRWSADAAARAFYAHLRDCTQVSA